MGARLSGVHSTEVVRGPTPGMGRPPDLFPHEVRAELDWARGTGGRVPAWNSPGRSEKGPYRAVLADGHLTQSPVAIQLRTTSFLVYSQNMPRSGTRQRIWSTSQSAARAQFVYLLVSVQGAASATRLAALDASSTARAPPWTRLSTDRSVASLAP